MKATFPFLLLFSCLKSTAQNYVWTQKANFPGDARYEAIGFSIGIKGYFGTGANFNLSSTQIFNDFWEWDQATNIWTQKANVPGLPRYGASSFSVSSKGYVTAGFSLLNGGPLNDLYEYDSSNNTWTQKASFPGGARYTAIGIAVAGYGYVGFGYTPPLKNDLWKYDHINNQWLQKTSFPSSARQSLSEFVVNDILYVCGGMTPNGASSELWAFNPSTNSWSQKANYPSGTCYGSIAFQNFDLGFVGTGTVNAMQSFNTFFSYNPTTNMWNQIANLPAPGRFAGDGFSIGNYGYAGLGRDHNFNFYNDLWEYGPDPTSISEPTPPLTFTAYPNPASEVINITLSDNWKNNALVSLTDMAGKSALKQTTGNQKEIQLNVSALAAGNYVLLVTAENGKVAAQQKVAVE